MFCAFAETGLTVKPSNCHLFMRQVKYVGHILGNGKRSLDASKTQAIAEWKLQDILSRKALKAFLGLANRCSIYIHKYADYAAPLMDALQGKYQYEPLPPELKGKLDGNGKPVKRKKLRPPHKQLKIEWTSCMKAAFETRKQGTVVNAELRLPNLSGNWRIESEASEYAVGGILKQAQPDGRWMPVGHFSRKLQGRRQNGKVSGQMGWTVHEKETYALLCCLLKLQSCIGLNEVVINTYHSSTVQWYKEDLCTTSGPLGRRGRWHEFLAALT